MTLLGRAYKGPDDPGDGGSEGLYPQENADCEVAGRHHGKSHHRGGSVWAHAAHRAIKEA